MHPPSTDKMYLNHNKEIMIAKRAMLTILSQESLS